MSKTTAKQQQQYPCIVAWGRMVGSYIYYIEQVIAQAREDGAPEDAIHFTNGKWARLGDVTSANTRWHFKQNYPELVAKYCSNWDTHMKTEHTPLPWVWEGRGIVRNNTVVPLRDVVSNLNEAEALAKTLRNIRDQALADQLNSRAVMIQTTAALTAWNKALGGAR